MDSVRIGKDHVVTGCHGIIDTGTSMIVADPSILNKVTNRVGPVAGDCSDIKNHPDVIFHIEGVEYLLTPEDYIVKITTLG